MLLSWIDGTKLKVRTKENLLPNTFYKLTLDGKLLGTIGKTGHQLKQFGWIHEMACPSENELYVAEVINWRVQKLLLHPEKGASIAAR